MRQEKELVILDGNDALAITAEEGKILSNLVRNNESKSILEIGTGYGYSTSWLRLGRVPDGIIFTIDEIDRCGMNDEDNFLKFYKSTLVEFLNLRADSFDFVFHDSEHTIDRIVNDIELLLPRLTDNSIIVVHDTEYCPEMGKLLGDYFKGVDSDVLANCGVKASKLKWTYENIKTKYGLGIAKRGEIKNG